MNLWIKFTFIFKIHLTTIVIVGIFNGLFNGKSSSVSNLFFIKSLSYSPTLPSFIVSMSSLIPSQSSLYFFNTSLFSSEECQSVEPKTKCYFPYFLRYVQLLYQSSDTKDLHYEYFHNHHFFKF